MLPWFVDRKIKLYFYAAITFKKPHPFQKLLTRLRLPRSKIVILPSTSIGKATMCGPTSISCQFSSTFDCPVKLPLRES